MFASHPAAQALKKIGAFKQPPTKAMLDAVEAEKQAVLDATAAAGAKFALDDIRSAAALAVKEWAGTSASDLDEGESLADRLLALAVGIADENKDGDITDEEAEVIDIALNAMADFLVSKGATEEDVSALLNDGDTDAAARVSELVAGDGGDDLSDVDSFTFDAESAEAVMDGVLDAVYKKKIVIRAGRKVRINKRVSGHVRLSAAQKVAIRRAGMKSRSSVARIHRLKSMKIRKRAGL